MRLGIDIDGVLTNIEQYVVDHFSKYCVTNDIEYNITGSAYECSKSFNVPKEAEDNFWNENIMDYSLNIDVRPFASEVIQKLKNEGHEIYIVTARWLTNRDDELGIKMIEIVKNWLLKNNIYYDKLVFAKSSNEEKAEEIEEHGIDLMIEDSPSNIERLSKIVPVICYHAFYNSECKGDNIIRGYSWYDIYSKIKKMH